MKSYKSKIHAAKAFARKVGAEGRLGGWIYDANGKRICQGWFWYAVLLERKKRIAPVDDSRPHSGPWLICG